MTDPLKCCSVRAFGCAWLLAAACTTTPGVRPPPEAAKPEPASNYEGTCSFMRLEAVERPSPAPDLGPQNLGSGSIEFVATYRPGTSGGAPIAYSFLVAQERAEDLRAHLQQNPIIVCRGESAGATPSPAPQSEGPTFEGQRGRRLPPPATSTPPPPAATTSP